MPVAEMPDFVLERPRHKSHGDWATNIALMLSADAGRTPREIADAIALCMTEQAEKKEGGIPTLSSIEVAGPGFINFTLDRDRIRIELLRVAQEGEGYGRWDFGNGLRVVVEFVSANPVGPLHIGHGRWAALGDALCNLLDAAGYNVEREFYLNDSGSQMETFTRSVDARYLNLAGVDIDFPPGGYRGEYIVDN